MLGMNSNWAPYFLNLRGVSVDSLLQPTIQLQEAQDSSSKVVAVINYIY